jgi:hypothetical protein
MKRAVLLVSAVACVALVAGQIAAALDFALIPQTASTLVASTGPDPQGPLDFALVIVTILGNVGGFLLAVAAGILGLVAAALRRRAGWTVIIALSGVVAFLALVVGAFVLLGLPNNPFDLVIVVVVAPLTTLAYSLTPERPALSTVSGEVRRSVGS